MEIRWSDRAIAELERIRIYVARFDPHAATRLRDRIVVAANSLGTFPNRAPEFRDGVRQLSTVYPYLIRYEVTDELVTIVSVRHGARGDV